MISALEWVPAGVAASNPKKYEMSKAERELIELMEQKGSIAEIEEEMMKQLEKKVSSKAKLKQVPESSLPADLRMDEYSSDEDDDADIGRLLVGQEESMIEEMVPEDEEEEEDDDRVVDDDDDSDGESVDEEDLADVPDTREFIPIDVDGIAAMGLSHVGTNSNMVDAIDDDNSDADDVRITDDDAIVLVAKTEEDFATLEVHVYDQKTGSLYVHHDIPLPAFPLCLAHGQVSCEGTAGNFCAVGTFNPGIEIWNLDVLNALEPSCILGGEDTSVADDIMKLQMMRANKSLQVPHKKSSGLRRGSHSDAVMALSWNPIHKQVIASGSADCTVKLWDITQANSDHCNAATFKHHRDKVQAVVWHPKEATLMATGSFDRTVVLLDARTSGKNVKSVKIGSDCEALAWDPTHSEYLTVASEDGTVACWDVRKFDTSTPLWSFVANEYGISDISYNPQVPGLMASCSVDKMVTLWDVYSGKRSPAAGIKPFSCISKDMCGGKLYSVNFYPSSPWLLACGGSGNQLSLWDISCEDVIQKVFKSRLDDSSQIEQNDVVSNKADFEAMVSVREECEKDGESKSKKKNKTKSKGKKKAHKKGH